MALESGQKMERVAYKDQPWLGLKTRSRKYFYSLQFIIKKKLQVSYSH